jgi:Ca2+-dependent lipid-binding protein
MIGQMDPFIIMEYEGLRFKSNVIKNGGKTPEWNQTFQIPISSPDGNIKI